jgi:hypothetical protein
MQDKVARPRRSNPHKESQIIGFRLPVPVAKAIKVEAARRQLPLNSLLVEMWELYREAKRAGQPE